MRNVLATLLLWGSLAPPSGALQSAERYSCFPPDAHVDAFRTEWLCRQLAAAIEGRIGSHVLYRFVLIPSFHPTRVAVVSVEGGKHFVVGKVLSGRGGYDAGSLVQVTKRELEDAELKLLEQRLENAEVWGPPISGDRRGFDGAEWLFEGKHDGRYYFHEVWSPDKEFPQYRLAGVYMLELAGVRPEDDILY
jgi:hypothetical protein